LLDFLDLVTNNLLLIPIRLLSFLPFCFSIHLAKCLSTWTLWTPPLAPTFLPLASVATCSCGFHIRL
jgi:hypothetical protein